MELPVATVEFCKRAEGWAQQRSPQACSLWAKSGDGVDFLNVPQHLVDTACAASLIFNSWVSQPVKDFLGSELQLKESELEALYLWLAGTHDVGKVLKSFQRLLLGRRALEHLVNAVSDAGLATELSVDEANFSKLPHSIASGEILSLWLEGQGVRRPKANAVAGVVNAHHGIVTGPNSSVRNLMEGYPAEWKAVHRELVEAMEELCGAEGGVGKLVASMPKMSGPAAQTLTGLVVMADWIASNEKAFTLRVQGSQLERTAAGAEFIDLTSPWAPRGARRADIDEFFRKSFNWPAEFQARRVQRAMVEAVQDLDEPALVVLEAETGVGKTEAALAAAEIMAARNGAQGVFFAAPTMATANGLLERTIEWAGNVAGNSVRSMYLAHSKNALSKPFAELKFNGINDLEESGGEVVASQWMSGSRLGILSNFVVGTVDQVLMMALQQRYSMLRHVGLAGKVVIFDEIHSFDVFTSDYLRSTIAWLGHYGASVILMSATLPPHKRRELVEAYSWGEMPEGEQGYPLITVATADEVHVTSVEPSPTNLVGDIQILNEEERPLSALLDQLLDEGGCVLVICNTIDRAQAAYSRLADIYGECVELHHAGFVAWERVEKEDSLRQELGPDSHRGAGRPWRKIVVATQVAEQSLDIDADVLITDIAPIDLLIQRIGRLHRHARPETDRPRGLQEPKIFIRGVLQKDPVPEFESGAEAIYGRAILMSTLAALPEEFRRPDDTAKLVAEAYNPDFKPPAPWLEAWTEAEDERRHGEATAHLKSTDYRLPDPRHGLQFKALFERLVDDSERSAGEGGAAQVRDIEPSVEVIPIIATDYGYWPWGWNSEVLDGGEISYKLAFHLASSTVRLPGRMTRYGTDFDVVVSQLEESTPGEWADNYLLRGQLALFLNESNEATVGRFEIRYSSELGIEIMSDGRG